MRLYTNCAEMHHEEKRNLHEMGVVVHPQTMQDKYVGDDENFRTLELSPCAFTILDPSDYYEWLDDLKLETAWLREDFSERVSSHTIGETLNPGTAWQMRRETWEPFLREELGYHGARFAYTYSERLGLAKQLTRTINELRNQRDTRQGVMPIYDATLDSHNRGGKKRVPCSMYYQFMRRGNGLRAIYTMRSCDFKTHFPYDIAMAAKLQEFIASELGIQTEQLIYFTGSLHMYQKDAEVIF